MSLTPETILGWRIERTCHRAWPALKETRFDDWLLRFSNGLSRRNNSANPTETYNCDTARLIAECEKQYRAENLPVYFRIPSIIGTQLEESLRQRGYTAEAESLVLHADIRDAPWPEDSEVKILQQPERGWLRPMIHAKDLTTDQAKTYTQIVKLIKKPAAFGMLCHQKHAVSLAIGVIDDGLLCFESIFTAAPFRKRGYARRVLNSLLAWAKTEGATGVCLQVQADNKPAIALYNDLGLKELYRYHYEREPVSN